MLLWFIVIAGLTMCRVVINGMRRGSTGSNVCSKNRQPNGPFGRFRLRRLRNRLSQRLHQRLSFPKCMLRIRRVAPKSADRLASGAELPPANARSAPPISVQPLRLTGPRRLDREGPVKCSRDTRALQVAGLHRSISSAIGNARVKLSDFVCRSPLRHCR
jgi:hypothetical protein